MPVPVLALLALGAGMGSAGGTLYGGFRAKKNAEDQAKYARELAEVRETALRRAAKTEENNRQQKASAMSDASLRRRAVMEARYAKAGVTLSGTPTVALAVQAAYDEQNVQAVNVASFHAQKSLRREARNEELAGINAANAALAAGKAAQRQAIMSAGMQMVKTIGGLGAAGGVADIAEWMGAGPNTVARLSPSKTDMNIGQMFFNLMDSGSGDE